MACGKLFGHAIGEYSDKGDRGERELIGFSILDFIGSIGNAREFWQVHLQIFRVPAESVGSPIFHREAASGHVFGEGSQVILLHRDDRGADSEFGAKAIVLIADYLSALECRVVGQFEI